MKKLATRLSLLIVALVTIAAVFAAPVETVQQGYVKIRTTENGDEADLVVLTTEGEWDARPSGIWRVPSSRNDESNANALSLAFAAGIDAGTTADAKTFSWKLYGWKGQWQPAEYIALGTGIYGTQDVGRLPDKTLHLTGDLRNWADTLVITTQYFPQTLAVSTVGSNSICKLSFDVAGYEYIYVEITSADGTTGTEAGDTTVWATWF